MAAELDDNMRRRLEAELEAEDALDGPTQEIGRAHV